MTEKNNLISITIETLTTTTERKISERNNIISIVTPSYNQGQFLADTIESVIFQRGNFYIDYIIIDRASTDNTINIIKTYESHLKDRCDVIVVNNKNYYVSRKDYNTNASEGDIWVKNPLNISCRGVSFTWESKKINGHYDAVKQGFEKASGTIFAYINSGDMYLSNAFDIVIKTLLDNPNIHWIKGLNVYFNQKNSFTFSRIEFSHYVLKKGYYAGGYGFPSMQQVSVFWTRDLYNTVGGISTDYKCAGDYALWLKFAKYENIYSIPNALAGSRFQKKHDIKSYNKEIELLVNRNAFQRFFSFIIHTARNSKLILYIMRPINKYILLPLKKLFAEAEKLYVFLSRIKKIF